MAGLGRRLCPAGASHRVNADLSLFLDFAQQDHLWYLTRGCPVFADALALANLVPEGATVIDVGANIGVYSLLLGRRVGPRGRVYAFEPVPATRAELARNLSLNGGGNVVPRPEAVSSACGEAIIYLGGNSSLASLLPEVRGSAVSVPTVTLDQFLAREKVGAVALVKVDVEGAELSVLRGMTNLLRAAAPPILYLEINSDRLTDGNSSPDDIRSFLVEYGYEPHLLSAEGRHHLTRAEYLADTAGKRCENYLFLAVNPPPDGSG